MRTIKVSHDKFTNAVKQKAKNCEFIRIPSTNEKYSYVGLMMAAGAWVAWPEDLTESEMAAYVESYGDIPDLFSPKTSTPLKFIAPTYEDGNGPEEGA